MTRRLRSALTCWLLLGAGIAQSQDQSAASRGGEFSVRIPAGWRTISEADSVEAGGNGIWMKIQFRPMVLSFRVALGRIAEDAARSWTGTETQDSSVRLAGNSASVMTIRGTDDKGVQMVRRVVLVNPIPGDAAGHTYLFVSESTARDFPAALPVMERIEQSFRLGGRDVPATPAAVRLEPYVAPSKLYALYKPRDWKVAESSREGALAVALTGPDGHSEVNLLWMRAARATMTRFIAVCRDALVSMHGGLTLSQIYVSRDGGRGMATVSYAGSRGRAYFEVTPTGATMQEYAFPEAQLAALRPLAMNMILSVSFIHGPKGGGGRQAPVQKPLVPRRAPDGSLSIRLPEDWKFLAAQGRIVAGEPGGAMGFLFNSYAGNPMMPRAGVAQGVIGTRFLPPAQTLQHVLAGYGHSNAVIHTVTPDRATMAECVSNVRNGCEAADILATWTSKEGAHCAGGFKVVNLRPGLTGQWSSILAGIWGPQQDFYRYFPLLEQVAGSFAVNDQFARRYIAAGLENLRALERQTAAAIQSLNYAREDMQRAWEQRQARKDYLESKWDDYRRGNSYWVSDLEGGKVYHTDNQGTRDTLTGDYYEGGGYTWTHFEGQNPRWANENMREVSSYELEHGPAPR